MKKIEVTVIGAEKANSYGEAGDEKLAYRRNQLRPIPTTLEQTEASYHSTFSAIAYPEIATVQTRTEPRFGLHLFS